MSQRFALLSALLFLPTSVSRAEISWPQFRGTDGQGYSTSVGLPLEWSETQNIVWKTPIKGRGWSSPVFEDGKIWLTTATMTPVSEEERAAKVAGSPVADAMEVASRAVLWAVEIDQQNGKVLRNVKIFEIDSPQPVHSLNSFASPTPVLAQGKLYCHFGAFGTACLDTSSGRLLWRQQKIVVNHDVGPGSSPLLVGNHLILTFDGTDQQFIVGLDAQTGEIAWKTNRPPLSANRGDFRKAFSTPLLIETAGRPQVVIPGAQWFVSYDPRTGEEIWRVEHGRGFSNAPRAVFDGHRLFLCTGFMRPQLWAVRPDGRGDVTATHVDWKQKKQIPTMSSPILVGNQIYVVSDGGVLSCFATDAGDLLWRARLGGKYSASPLYADGRLYFCSQDGQTTVIAPGKKYQEFAKNHLNGQLMASPAVVGSDLLLRTDTHLYRIGVR